MPDASALLQGQLRPMPPEPWGRKLKRARWPLVVVYDDEAA
jgi:hypothetical protein